MKRISVFFLIVVFVGFFHSGLWAQDDAVLDKLDLESLVSLSLANDPDLRIAASSLESAFYGYRKQIAGTYPTLTIGPDSGSNTYGFRSGKNSLSGDWETSHSFSLGLSIMQLLPTAGSLSLSLHDTMSLYYPESGSDAVSQNPSLGFTLNQPIFVNGKLIDTELFQAGLESSKISYRIQEARNRKSRNLTVFTGVSTYLNIINLENDLSYLRDQLQIERRELELDQLRFEQGDRSRSDVWEQEIEVRKIEESIVSLEYNLLQAKQSLAKVIGVEGSLEDTEFSTDIDMLEFNLSAGELIEAALAGNPELRIKDLGRESAEKSAVLSGEQYASNLSFNLSLSPEYAPSRSSSDDLGASFRDLFSEDAYLSITGGVSLTVPIYTGGEAGHQERIDEAGIVKSEAEYRKTLIGVRQSLEALLLARRLYNEQIELHRENRGLAKQRLEDNRRLFELKSATKLDVARTELEVKRQENKLFAARGNLFLNSLDILSLTGQDLAGFLGVTED